MSFLCSAFCMPQSRNEIELTFGDKSKEKKFRILAPDNSRSKSKNRVNPNFHNKANTRANVKVFSSKPFNSYKNLVDTSDINESIIVEETPVTTVSKITQRPKKRTYKKFEELEIVKASKKASKRLTKVEYDKDFVYGAVSSSAHMPSTKLDKIKQKEEDLDQLYGSNKIVERESEYNHSDEEKQQKNKRKSDLKVDYEDDNYLKQTSKKNRRVLEEEEFVIENKNSYENHRSNNQNVYESQGLYNNEPFADLKDKISSNKIKRDNKFLDNQQLYNIRDKVSNKLQSRDIYSCQYCEEVYRIIIFQNLPVKVFDCYYCQNMINPVSLDFYYKKYENELIELQNSMNLNKSINKNPIITPKNRQDELIENEPHVKLNKSDNVENNFYSPVNETRKELDKKPKDKAYNDRYEAMNIKPITIEEEKEPIRREIKIEEEIKVNRLKVRQEKIVQEEPKVDRKSKIGKVIDEKEKQEKIDFKPTLVKGKLGNKSIISEVLEDNQKIVNFDRDWVKWNAAQNAEKFQENSKKKELIEISVSDGNDLRGSSLAEAFKKKKKDLIKRFESKEKEIKIPNNNIENTIIEDKKNSKNVTRNDIHDDTNCTRSDFKGDCTTIGEILNDSELRPLNISCKNPSEKKKKNKYEGKNVILEENEPSKELLDRLIYGKKAELNKKEIKEVNKRMYSKLVESKEKEKDEEIMKKKEELVKNKEKLKQYAYNLKNSVVKKQK